jgi:hypothetical protein
MAAPTFLRQLIRRCVLLLFIVNLLPIRRGAGW